MASGVIPSYTAFAGMIKGSSGVFAKPIPSFSAEPASIALNGMNMGGPVSWDGTGHFGRPLQNGAIESTTVGNPPPSLQLSSPGFWRFKWTLQAGARTISVQCLQTNIAPYPSMVVKANAAIGIPSDLMATVLSGGVFVTIGPINITATAEGATWVELHNNLQLANSPCWFDNIITT